MDAAAKNPLIRRELLEILHDAVTQARQPGDDISTYVLEALLQRVLARRGWPMRLEEMRAQLLWLHDRGRRRDDDHGFVKFRETKAAGEKHIFWRITDRGVDVLEGTVEDPGVASA